MAAVNVCVSAICFYRHHKRPQIDVGAPKLAVLVIYLPFRLPESWLAATVKRSFRIILRWGGYAALTSVCPSACLLGESLKTNNDCESCLNVFNIVRLRLTGFINLELHEQIQSYFCFFFCVNTPCEVRACLSAPLVYFLLWFNTLLCLVLLSECTTKCGNSFSSSTCTEIDS